MVQPSNRQAAARAALGRALGVAAILLALQHGSVGAAERVLRRTTTDDPSTLDPQKMSFPGEQVVILDMFMGLTTLGPNGRPMPGCAESWTISPDGRSYDFTLRPGLQWSDGRPLTAEDWAWSLRRALEPKTAFAHASRLFPVRNARRVVKGELPSSALGVKALSTAKLRIELESPTPYFTDVIATAFMPLPRHAVEKFGGAWARPGNFVSNGPFVLETWLPNTYVRMKKNPRFWGAAQVRLDAVIHYPTDNPFTLVRKFAEGSVDLVMIVPPERQQWARQTFGNQLKLGLGVSNEVLVFNTRRGPTTDVRVRRALSMAIDRETIANRILGVPQAAPVGYVPPGILNYDPPGGRARMDFLALSPAARQTEARRLLGAAGYTAAKPLKMRLLIPNADLHRTTAVSIANDWRKLGMVVPELTAKETKSLVGNIANGDFDSVRVVWLANYSDPYAFLERMLSTGSTVGVNQSGYRNEDYDRLLGQATQEVDLTRRAAILRDAEALALQEQPVAPVHYLVGRRLISNRIQDFVDNPRGMYPAWYVTVPSH
jgi:oligopeptide transport system substrate-binding protein